MLNRLMYELRKWIIVLGLWASIGVIVGSFFFKTCLEGPVLAFIGIMCFAASIYILRHN